MNFKRNFKLYIKQKSTVVAFIFYIVFIILTIISFIPYLFEIKGISENFNNYKVTYITTNNYTTTYVGSDNTLFYSQNKSQNSTLNNFSNIKEYANEYGSATSHPYNFIKIDYKFDSNITKVVGISDNYLGEDGETLILTQKNYLYLISKRSKTVDYLLNNVSDVFAFYSRVLKNNVYFIVRNNNTYFAYFINNQISMYEIGNYSDCFLTLSEDNIYKFIVKENDEISILTLTFNDEVKDTLKGFSYLINEYKVAINNKEKLSSNVSKIIFDEKKIYLLKENKCYFIDDEYQINLIYCDKDIIDIYFTGEDACIAITSDDLYYFGTLKYFNKATEEFLKINIKGGLVYGNRNSLIVYKNNKLYLYDENVNDFVIMYSNILLNKIMKIFNVFVVIMLTFYFILSYKEASERYNRYFSSSKNNKI